MVGKENLAFFECSNISKTIKATPTKIGVHACDINPYLHEFFEPILCSVKSWFACVLLLFYFILYQPRCISDISVLLFNFFLS